ncbi:hypothetical protein UA08_02000 [Talaromyces atroroseus]|uniref:Mediator of RNA polymerase II transcription subunit 12 n=1 Tax=Talaromyces atroroseus TaxID=1441469 RepID=A0A1Q5QAZ6_TALAT|nr:hypothetical protein UA08_02000 [Talaromyces atroroseus]OKL63096.1 hypothetical protein UA08_02000 [Talaromyces atroroseus]
MSTLPSSTGNQTWTSYTRPASTNEPRPSMAVAPAAPAQQLIDLSASDGGPLDSEQPHKRPRLDTNVAALGHDGRTPSKSAEARSVILNGSTARTTAVSGRSRPAYSFQELVTDTYGGVAFTANATPGSQTPKPPSPPPFPVRPWMHAPARQSQVENVGPPEDTRSRDVQTNPYRPEIPTIAPRLNREKVADYSPWSRLGNHPEDKLTEFAVKQGYYDKIPGSSNNDLQPNTSKLSGHLKNRSGLQLLSAVFAAALDKRQVHDKISSTSTFKPPPRVTLTDNKREAWLRDLANSAVPLRRLSRTIPHGIRGKVLLDQCLGKGVPIGRAVWLAKCVGANEIRAFKRKGTSGSLSHGLEIKWVREWTIGVQQFIEGVIGACGKEGWRSKMTYAVRLAARLFFENLLDQDCYLDWYMSSIEASTLDVFPIWLAMLSIYWENLVRFRQRGRRLSEALLEKLREATLSEYKAHLQPLIDRVSVIVRRLCQNHSPCVILPRSWDRYQDIISSLLMSDDPKEKALFQSLVLRNARVQRPRAYISNSRRSPQQQIIKLLDSSRDAYNIGALSHTCLSIMPNRGELVSVLLKWTASPFRQGIIRVYIAVRLLRKWKRSGMDIDAFIFSFLTQTSIGQTAHMINIYHTIVELIRSHTFSVGRYLQWLVARGAVEQYRQGSSPDSHVPVDIDLLFHIPSSRLPRHLRNLRDTLMTRAGLLLSSETAILQGIKGELKKRLPQVLRKDDIEEHKMAIDLERNNLTWSIKADISQWIRAAVSEHYEYGPSYQQKIYHHEGSIEVSSLTHEEFLTIRSTLEQYGDLSMLADILINASNSDDVQLLTCGADTLNCHFGCFTVIGALNDLFRNFYEAFLRVKHNPQPVYDLAYSLCEVARRLPNGVNSLLVLRQALSRADRNLALAACSPVSDHVAETLSDSNPSFNEDMDQLLSSGNSMDETTMMIVFQKLIQQLVLYDEKDASMPGTVCRHLVQLRSFNPKHFDLLLVQWLEATIKTTSRPKLSRTLRPLVSIGCVTLPAFAILIKKVLVPDLLNPTVPEPLELLVDFLELLVPVHDLGPVCDFLSYRFRIAQEEFLCEHSHEALGVIQDAVSQCTQAQSKDLLDDQKPLVRYMVPLLREIIVRHPDDITLDTIRTLVKGYPAFGLVVRKTVDMLLNDNNQGSLDFLTEAATTIKKTDNLSLPLCQMKLQILFNEKHSDDIMNTIVDLMYKSAIADVRAGHTYWLDLVSTMGQEAAEQIRQRAEKEFFSVAQSDSALEKDSESERLDLQENARVYLAVIDGLAYSIPEEGVPSVGPPLVEKLNSLLHKLFAMHVNVRNLSELRNHTSPGVATHSISACEENFLFWFTAILQMIRIHRAAFDQPASSTNNRPGAFIDLSRTLIIICCLALSRTPMGFTVQPRLDLSALPPFNTSTSEVRTENTIQTYALDMASSLVDSLPDEARQQCANFIRERFPPSLHVQNDPRLLFLFGPVSETFAPGSVSVSSPASTLTPSANPPAMSAVNTGTVVEDYSAISNRLRVQSRGRIVGSYSLRPWEMLEEAAPVVGANDTAIDLNLFGARKVRDY